MQAELFHQNLSNKPVGRADTYHKKFPINHVEHFLVTKFSGSLWKSCGKVPVVEVVLLSHEQEVHPTTFLDENCIEFEFQTDYKYYVDLRHTYLALKLKLTECLSYETYNTEKKKKST